MSEQAPARISQGLHFSFQGDVLLFGSLKLIGIANFCMAVVIVFAVCLLERYITLLLMLRRFPKRWQSDITPTRAAIWRGGLYGGAVTLRLLYMLLSMSLHVGIIATIVLSLTFGQLVIEYHLEAHKLLGASSAVGNKDAEYAPIPMYTPHSADRFPGPPEDDLESAPSYSGSHIWAGSRDKARQIMLGPTTAAAPPTSPETQIQFAGRETSASRLTSGNLHGRQLSANSFRRGGSFNTVQGLRRGNSITSTGSVGRRPLFQIGSGDEHTTSDSD